MLVKLVFSSAVISLLLAAPSAQANSDLLFGLTDPGYTYYNSGTFIILGQNLVAPGSTLTVQTLNEETNALASTSLVFDGYTGAFRAALTLTSSGQDNDWSASGQVTFSDANFPFSEFPNQQALAANFQSTQVWLTGDATDGYQLGITGVLTPQAGDTMLVNSGSPWVFTGNTTDADGNPLTVTADAQDNYASGTVTFLSNITVGEHGLTGPVYSLDQMMQTSTFYGSGGAVDGTVFGTPAVPEPLTMIGLVLSIGVLGTRLRKCIKRGAVA